MPDHQVEDGNGPLEGGGDEFEEEQDGKRRGGDRVETLGRGGVLGLRFFHLVRDEAF